MKLPSTLVLFPLFALFYDYTHAVCWFGKSSEAEAQGLNGQQVKNFRWLPQSFLTLFSSKSDDPGNPPLTSPVPPTNPISLFPELMSLNDVVHQLKRIVSVGDPTNVYQNLEFVRDQYWGKVYAATQVKSGRVVSIKKMNLLNLQYAGLLINEILVMKYSRHENIVSFVDAYLLNDDVWLVTEYMNGGSLSDLVHSMPLTEGQVAAVAREVMKGLLYLHSQDVIHREINSSNVLLSNQGSVKLADFGLSVQINGFQTKYDTKSRTSGYMAPEMVAGEEYGPQVDIWSFGILVIEMIEGRTPSIGRSASEVFRFIAENGSSTLSRPEKLTPELQDFLAKCLKVDPEQRPSADELLEHPFLKRADKLSSLAAHMQQLI